MTRAHLAALLAAMLCSACVAETPQPQRTSTSSLSPELAGELPPGYDLDGTWTVAPGRLITETVYSQQNACNDEFARENALISGRDTLVLKKGEVTVTDGIITVPYTGTYSHWDGFGQDIGDGVAYGCVAENINYDIVGELWISLETGQAWFDAEGTATNTATYNHPRSVRLAPAYVGSAVNSVRSMFENDDRDVALLNVGFGDYQGSTELPEGCDFELADEYYSERNRTAGCIGVILKPFKFERVSGLPDIAPRGDITGVVEEALPDGMPTSRKVANAKIGIFRQPRHVRDKLPNESDADYAAYIDQVTDDRRFIRNVVLTPDAMGKFSFPDLKSLVRDPGQSTIYRQAEYTLEVSQGRSQEINAEGASETLLFELGRAYNIRVGQDEVIRLRPFDALGPKIDLASQLQFKAPLGYGAAETATLVILEELRDGVLRQVTPAANEAVRRAIWGEIAARDGLSHATLLTGFMLDAFATLVTDFLIPDISLNPRKIAKAQKRINDFSPEAARSQSALEILQSQRIEEFHERLARRPYASLGVKAVNNNKAKRAVYVKAMAKAAVFNPVKILGASYASDPELVNSVVDAVQLAFEGIVDIVLTGEFGGVIKSVIKKRVGDTIKASKAKLVDNDSILFNSYTQRSRAGLERGTENLDSWVVDDPVAYRADRDVTVQALSRMNTKATNLIAEQELRKGLADGISASEDTFAALNAVPGFAAAEKVAKLIKVLQNVNMFVQPMVYTYFELPTEVEEIGYLTWGETRPIVSPLVYSGTLYDRNPLIVSDLRDAVAAYEARLNEINAALDDHETLFDLVHGTDTIVPLSELYDRVELTRDRAIDEAAGWDLDEEFWTFAITQNVSRVASGSKAHIPMVEDLCNYIIEVMTGAFPDKQAWYRMRMASVGAKIAAELDALPDIENATAAMPNRDNAIAQLVRAEQVRTVDEAGNAFLVAGSNHTITVSADITNLSIASIDNISARLVATADRGSVSVVEPVQDVPTTLGPYDGSSQNTATLNWTVNYTGGEPGDVVVLRVELDEAGAAPTRYNGSGAIGMFTPDPETYDVDFDGLPDPWELQHGLPIDTDNWDSDSDQDGAKDSVEYARGLDPTNADTDADGRTDGDELFGGALQLASDPLNPDTDEDGTPDGSDQAPTDETSTTPAPTAAAEPCVLVAQEEVHLTFQKPWALIGISNGCDGNLVWTARVDDPNIAKTWLGTDEQGGQVLVVSYPGRFENAFEYDPVSPLPRTTLTVFDVAGNVPDGIDVAIILGDRDETPGEDMGTTTLEPSDSLDMGTTTPGGGADGGTGGGGKNGDGDDGGCSCSSTTGDPTGLLLLASVLILRVRRRRRRRA